MFNHDPVLPLIFHRARDTRDNRFRVLIADNHAMVRDTLAEFLNRLDDIDVVAAVANDRDAVQVAQEHQLDIAIVAVFAPVTTGLDTVREILREIPCVRIVLLSESPTHDLTEALRLGVHGCLDKASSAQELAHAVRVVGRGGLFLDSQVSSVASNQTSQCAHALSKREREILTLIANGYSTKQIASTLNVSARTADHHRENLMRKLDTHGIAALTRFAIRLGYVEP